MGLSLKKSNAVAAMAQLLCDFLPGSGNPNWKRHVSFPTVAAKVGVGDFYPGGSKEPAIATLLQHTLEQEGGLFQPLILEIVRSGILYRQKKNDPIRVEEIDRLNGLILDVNRLFHAFELHPRKPFRVIGEQIDGSFELDHETYLVEAKWKKSPHEAGESP